MVRPNCPRRAARHGAPTAWPAALAGTALLALSACDGAPPPAPLSPTRALAGETIVSSGLAFASVSAGSLSTCGLTGSGAAYCWGYNNWGQLGIGTTGPRYCLPAFAPCSPVPAAVVGGLTFVAVSISTGGYHSCGITPSGAAYCWGANFAGQLGIGTATGPELCFGQPCSTAPVLVQGGLTFASIAVGSIHTCGVTTSAVAYCWGSNGLGQYGNGDYRQSYVPVRAAGGLELSEIAAAEHRTCGLTSAGVAYCWGDNRYGQLGVGTTQNSPVPLRVLGGLTFTVLSLGDQHTCGHAVGAGAYCWGENSRGQLGIGTHIGPETCDPGGAFPWCSTVPVAVRGGAAFAWVDAGGEHSCGVTPQRTASCWGDNRYGQLGAGSATGPELCPTIPGHPGFPCSTVPLAVAGAPRFVALDVGGVHACGARRGGAAYCWGNNAWGQLGINESAPFWPRPIRVLGP
jgi:alpha-tubulin suppressor-like RCC1 family protein